MTLSHFCKDQFTTASQSLESWRNKTPCELSQATDPRDVDDVIAILSDMNKTVARCVEHLWELGFAGKIPDAEATGKDTIAMLDEALRTWKLVRNLADFFVVRGYVIRGVKEADAAIAEVQRWRDDFAKRWPFLPNDYNTVVANRKQEKVLDAEELLRELQDQAH